jgi:Rieske Fe-S protein
MERRDFIKSGCQLCLLAGAAVAIPGILACGAAKYPVFNATIAENRVSVPVSLFDAAKIQFIRPKGLFYDIAVEKKEDGSYTALLLQCTHQDNQLTPTGDGFRCSMHGSFFNKAGYAMKGPAESPLTKYKTAVNQNALIIYL